MTPAGGSYFFLFLLFPCSPIVDPDEQEPYTHKEEAGNNECPKEQKPGAPEKGDVIKRVGVIVHGAKGSTENGKDRIQEGVDVKVQAVLVWDLSFAYWEEPQQHNDYRHDHMVKDL